jgi:pyruvate dehydrogenase E1 component alpha subunit
VIGPELITAVDREAAAAADRLRLDIFDAPAPSPLEVFDHVYADPPAALLEQRRQLAAELAAWADAGDTPTPGPTVAPPGGGDDA